MNNKNSKSDSYIVREAENIIEKYLEDREMTDIKKYYNLKEKYERLQILTIAVFITGSIGTLLSVFLGQVK